MTNKFAAAAAAAASTKDYTQAKSGGGDYTPLAEGPCRLRLVGYVELGQHAGEYQGKPKKNYKAKFYFEVSGPKHPPREFEGQKFPNIVTVTENISQSDKARFFKLFGLLNHAGTAKHPAELLGNAYKGSIVHRKYKPKGSTEERVAVDLYDKKAGTYTIGPARYEVVGEDGPTGEFAELKVDAPLSDLRCFIWDHADMEQWASIFVDGQYDEVKNDKGEVTKKARSKNVDQELIRSALNYAGSPIDILLGTNGKGLDLQIDDEEGEEGGGDEPSAASTATGTAPPAGTPDPLAGVA